MFGILSTGGTRDGKQLLGETAINHGLTPLSNGPDTVIFGAPIRFGVGYDLGLGLTTVGGRPHPPHIFGHSGIGGSVAFGDPKSGLGYGFVGNRMHKLKDLYRTSNNLTRTVLALVS
jgi:CubicO group peptidase (beta-lactamase class C family)